jgi:hypothetical protein
VETGELRRLANATGVCVSLTVDPAADHGERWVAELGLDAIGAGCTPSSALVSALQSLAGSDAWESIAPALRRRPGRPRRQLEQRSDGKVGFRQLELSLVG